MRKYLKSPENGNLILHTPATAKTHPGWIVVTEEEVSGNRLTPQEEAKASTDAEASGLSGGATKKKRRKKNAATKAPEAPAKSPVSALDDLVGGLTDGTDD